MTAPTTPAVSAGGTPPAAPPSSFGASWLASWRISLRLARRDVRRHRGRSLAALLMVGVPTMLICLGLVIGATSQISREEAVPLTMGPAQASITTVDEGRRITQPPDPMAGYASTDVAAREIPEARAGGTAEMNAAAVGDLVGGEAMPWTEGRTRVSIGDRDLGLDTLAVPTPSRLTGKITLHSGRWPTGEDEVLVSPEAVRRGVPTSGRLHLAGDDTDGTLTVVGTADARTVWGGSHELVTTTTAPMIDAESTSGWYVMRDAPVTWSDVTRLNEYGLLVDSAHVALHPPSADELDPEFAQLPGEGSDQLQITVLGATLLLIVIALLVGPAFAVGATRQRRTLALAASNGATAGQLRRTVLAQALVLGGLSALVGAALAVPLGWLAARVLADHGSWMGPFEVPWWQLAAICAIAVVAAVLAALVPAQRLTHLDIVGAMRGRVVTPPPSRWLFVLGLVLVAMGGAGVIVGLDRTELYIVLAAILLVLGALLLVPRILHTLGRLAGPLPLPLRLAVRDLARHRTRSAPTVAAVLAGSAALTMGLIGATSDDAQGRAEYVPQALDGEASVYVNGTTDPGRDPMDAVHRELPRLVTTTVHDYGAPYDETTDPDGPQPFAVTIPTGCTAEQALTPYADDRCAMLSAGGGAAMSMLSIRLMPADEIIRRFALSGRAARTITDGGGVLVSASPGEVADDGRVTLARGRLATDPDTGEPGSPEAVRSDRVRVVTPPDGVDAMAASMQSGLILPTELAERDDWPITGSTEIIRDPDGPMDDATAERVQQILGDEVFVEVERGYQNPLGIVIAVLIGLFTLVLVVVTLTATALSLAEQERDQATIAAVGGARRTRRLMVAAQTWLLATVGVVLGALVGSFPGITLARALTSQSFDPMTGEALERSATIVVPWLDFALVLVVVPLLAAVLAGVGIRRTPDLTRRTE